MTKIISLNSSKHCVCAVETQFVLSVVVLQSHIYPVIIIKKQYFSFKYDSRNWTCSKCNAKSKIRAYSHCNLNRLFLEELVQHIEQTPKATLASHWKEHLHVLPAPLRDSQKPRSWRHIYNMRAVNSSLSRIQVCWFLYHSLTVKCLTDLIVIMSCISCI